MSRLPREVGAYVSQPYGPSWPVTGIALPFFIRVVTKDEGGIAKTPWVEGKQFGSLRSKLLVFMFNLVLHFRSVSRDDHGSETTRKLKLRRLRILVLIKSGII
jgi:hypothetical protein